MDKADEDEDDQSGPEDAEDEDDDELVLTAVQSAELELEDDELEAVERMNSAERINSTACSTTTVGRVMAAADRQRATRQSLLDISTLVGCVGRGG